MAGGSLRRGASAPSRFHFFFVVRRLRVDLVLRAGRARSDAGTSSETTALVRTGIWPARNLAIRSSSRRIKRASFTAYEWSSRCGPRERSRAPSPSRTPRSDTAPALPGSLSRTRVPPFSGVDTVLLTRLSGSQSDRNSTPEQRRKGRALPVSTVRGWVGRDENRPRNKEERWPRPQGKS